MLESLGREIAEAVAGCLRAGKRAAEGQTLAGDDAALKAVYNALILAVHIGNLTAADTDVARRGIRELTDVTVELGHKALAEAHDLLLALAFGVKVGTALAAAHGKGGERVLQDLLEAQKLDNGKIHAGMEAKPAFIRTDGTVILYPVAAVNMDFSVIVNPGNTEFDDALGLNKALKQTGLFPFGMLVNHQFERLENLSDSLQKLGLMGIAFFYLGIDTLEIIVCKHRCLLVNNG